MNAYARILPYLWPYRRALVLSAFCALAISFFWAANLSATLPVVELLFKGKSLHTYVDDKITEYQGEVDEQQRVADAERDDPHKLDRALRKGHAAAYRVSLLTMVRDQLMPWVPQDNFRTMCLVLLGLVIGTVFKGTFIYLEDILVGDAINHVIIDVRKDCFRHALNMDYQSLSANGSAHFTSRLVNDIEVLGAGLHAMLIRVVREPLKAGGCILFAFMVNWRLTLLSILVMPCLGWMLHRFGRSLKKASHGTLESITALQKALTETFDSAKAVIAFGNGRKHRNQFHHANKFYWSKARRVLRLSSLSRQLSELIGVAAVLAAVFPGSYLLLNQTDTFLGIQLSEGVPDEAQLALLYGLLAGTLDSIRKMSSVNRELRRGSAACERVLEIIDQKTQVPEPAEPRPMPRLSSRACGVQEAGGEGAVESGVVPRSFEIRFEGVVFRYFSHTKDGVTRPPALNNVDLTVRQGEVVAVVGANGSGKSTLINLIPRFFDPDTGRVLIDGVNIREVSSRELRSRIGIVSQETLLFDDTIFNNIRYGKMDASNEEIEQAAQQAHVMPFVAQLPDGFDTMIGEKGMKLSGGQRQRLALARAIIRDPDILILDEATSAIDAQSEQIIHNVLKSFVKDRTVFIISHVFNETFLDLVTRIVVMDNGRVVATGTHVELLASCPTYQRLNQANGITKAA